MLATRDLSYASGASASPLLGRTIGADLERTVARFGDREALVDASTHRRWTYSELDVEIDEVARGLIGIGVGPGDRVAVMAPNCAEWVLVQFAAAKIGGVLVPIPDPASGHADASRVLERSGASVLVAAHPSASDQWVEQMHGRCPALRAVVWIGGPSWHELIDKGGRSDNMLLRQRLAAVSFDDAVSIHYPPAPGADAAVFTHHTCLNNGYSTGTILGYSEHDRVCIPVPFAGWLGSVAGVLAAASHGGCIVIPAATFDPSATLQAVQDERCTSLLGTVDGFVAELDVLAARDLMTLRTGIVAGDSCPVEVIKGIAGDLHMPEVTRCRADSGAPVIAMTRRDDDPERRASSIGRVMPHVEVMISNATGTPAPHGEMGELLVRGYPARHATHPGGWMSTGDRASMDSGGYLAFAGALDPEG